MKSYKLLLPILLLLIACKQNNSENNTETEDISIIESSNLTLEGTWELTGYYNYKDNIVTDSFDTNAGYRQIKMYTPTKVMWSKDVPTDSTEWYGYGSYKVVDSTLTEVLEYGSTSMKKIIEDQKEFIFELHLNENKFSQVMIDEEGNRIYSENFKRIE